MASSNNIVQQFERYAAEVQVMEHKWANGQIKNPLSTEGAFSRKLDRKRQDFEMSLMAKFGASFADAVAAYEAAVEVNNA
jgi:hypothetical protein